LLNLNWGFVIPFMVDLSLFRIIDAYYLSYCRVVVMWKSLLHAISPLVELFLLKPLFSVVSFIVSLFVRFFVLWSSWFDLLAVYPCYYCCCYCTEYCWAEGYAWLWYWKCFEEMLWHMCTCCKVILLCCCDLAHVVLLRVLSGYSHMSCPCYYYYWYLHMRHYKAGYICGFVHVARQGENIIMCLRRDSVGIYFIIAHMAR